MPGMPVCQYALPNLNQQKKNKKHDIDDCGNSILRCSAPPSHHDNTFLIY